MVELVAETEIAAPIDMVWAELMTFEAYPEWNPFIRKIEGKAAEGERLTVCIQPSGGRGMTFRPSVLAVRSGVEFRWKGKLLVPGLLDGEHSFHLESRGPRRTRLVQREVFTGLLVPLFAAELNRSTRRGFVGMNEALKARAEARAESGV